MKKFRFDLQPEERGADVNMLKETVITGNFIGWMEEWKKEKHKKNDTVVRVLFANKYKDRLYHLPAQSENDVDRMYSIQEKDIDGVEEGMGGGQLLASLKTQLLKKTKYHLFLLLLALQYSSGRGDKSSETRNWPIRLGSI